MDLRQLNTFRAVAETGSLSKASDRLRIAQPALSRQIKLLEHDLRTPLFIRHGRGMALTDAGQLLFNRTRGVVRQLEQAREDVQSHPGTPFGRVVVGMVPTIGGALALPVTRQIVARYPGVSLRILDAYGGYLVEGLQRMEIDVAVVYGPAAALHLDTEVLRDDELLAVGAADGDLASGSEVSLDWLAGQRLVLPSSPHALRALVDKAFHDRGHDVNVPVEADSFQVLLDLVAGGIGLTLLPYYAIADRIGRDRVCAVRVKPALRRELVLALPSRSRASQAALAVADVVRQEALKLVA
jgi:LysR family nitrogen assimilation transcriptional regulator